MTFQLLTLMSGAGTLLMCVLLYIHISKVLVLVFAVCALLNRNVSVDLKSQLIAAFMYPSFSSALSLPPPLSLSLFLSFSIHSDDAKLHSSSGRMSVTLGSLLDDQYWHSVLVERFNKLVNFTFDKHTEHFRTKGEGDSLDVDYEVRMSCPDPP